MMFPKIVLTGLLAVIPFDGLALQAQPFIPNDVALTNPKISVQDIEFDIQGARLTWQDRVGNLWIADVNPQSGVITPPTGQGQRLDKGLAPLQQTNNGPEWAWGQPSAQIVYTKLINNEFYVARAFQASGITGSWTTQVLPNTATYFSPIGSKNPQDVTPQILSYSRSLSPIAWNITNNLLTTPGGVLNNPYLSQGITSIQGLKGGRWEIGNGIETDFGFAFQIPVNGYDQIAHYDTLTKTVNQISFDSTQKANAFIWEAPEYNNDLVVFATVNDTTIQVWRNVNNAGLWQLITTINPPNARPFVNSPEPFVYKGKSYIFYLRAENTGTSNIKGPSDLWFSSIIPDSLGDSSLDRQVSIGTLTRSDPEYFSYDPQSLTNPDGKYPLYLYYAELAQGLAGVIDGTRIIHRCDTGL